MSGAIQFLMSGFHAACIAGNYVCFGIETVLHVNYVIVSSVFGTLAYFAGVLKTAALSIGIACLDTIQISMEVWKDLVNFAGLALNAAAGFGHHLVCGVSMAAKWTVRTLLPGVWNGLIKCTVSVWKGLIYCWNSVTSSVTTSAVYVSDAVQIGTKTGGEVVCSTGEFLYDATRSLISAFHLICDTAMTYCVEIWVTTVIVVSQIYKTLIEKLLHLHEYFTTSFHHFWHCKLSGISSEVWLLLIQTLLSGFLIVLVLRYLDSRGYTFPSFRQQNRNLENILDESDVENLGDDDEISDNESDDGQVSVAGSEASHISHASTASHHSNISNGLRYNLRDRRSNSPPLQTSDALTRALELERDRRRCVVCQDQSKNVLLLPCRHMCLCGPCAQTLTRTAILYRRICPLCRAPIEAIMSVFV